ncbi:MAG TPA: hypothetical protein VNI53_05570 [Gammaproteobacteria bacterium]|nr:hypothetical protein [Gammaproteobacteria bacterium]
MSDKSWIMVILDRGLQQSSALLRTVALALKSGDRLLELLNCDLLVFKPDGFRVRLQTELGHVELGGD